MPFGSLWLPVVVSAAVVWIASAIAWMALPHHKQDFLKLPNEDGVADALRKLALPPGQYVLPHMQDMKDCKDPTVVKRLEDGPIASLRIQPNGAPKMGKSLIQYFLYCFVVSFCTAYVARHTLTLGASFLEVFRLTGAMAVASYTLAMIPDSIWMGRPWFTTFKSACDSVAYGLMTGLIFAWLWPHG